MASQSITDNPNYIVTISRGGAGGEKFGNLKITANAAAKLNLSIDNRWVNVLEALGVSGDGGIASSIFNAAQLATGENLVPVIATAHVWRASSGIEITLEMRFDAYDDAATDVLKPVETIIAMFSPVRGGSAGAMGSLMGGLTTMFGASSQVSSWMQGQFLKPPGPTPASYIKSMAIDGKKTDPMAVTVILGKVLTITNLIPTKLSWEFENRFTEKGDPICAIVSASFMSYTIPALDDIMKFFQNRNNIASILATAGSNANANPNVPVESSLRSAAEHAYVPDVLIQPPSAPTENVYP